jgi:hypothetical protein
MAGEISKVIHHNRRCSGNNGKLKTTAINSTRHDKIINKALTNHSTLSGIALSVISSVLSEIKTAIRTKTIMITAFDKDQDNNSHGIKGMIKSIENNSHSRLKTDITAKAI